MKRALTLLCLLTCAAGIALLDSHPVVGIAVWSLGVFGLIAAVVTEPEI